MKIYGEWNKIGEVEKAPSLLRGGVYARYAVFELVTASGMRKYKEVFMCSWTEACNVPKFQNS